MTKSVSRICHMSGFEWISLVQGWSSLGKVPHCCGCKCHVILSVKSWVMSSVRVWVGLEPRYCSKFPLLGGLGQLDRSAGVALAWDVLSMTTSRS